MRPLCAPLVYVHVYGWVQVERPGFAAAAFAHASCLGWARSAAMACPNAACFCHPHCRASATGCHVLRPRSFSLQVCNPPTACMPLALPLAAYAAFRAWLDGKDIPKPKKQVQSIAHSPLHVFVEAADRPHRSAACVCFLVSGGSAGRCCAAGYVGRQCRTNNTRQAAHLATLWSSAHVLSCGGIQSIPTCRAGWRGFPRSWLPSWPTCPTLCR